MFTTAEYMFATAEYMFRSAEHNTNDYYEEIATGNEKQLQQAIMKTHDYSRNILNVAEVPRQQTNGDTRGRNVCRGEKVQRASTLPK